MATRKFTSKFGKRGQYGTHERAEEVSSQQELLQFGVTFVFDVNHSECPILLAFLAIY